MKKIAIIGASYLQLPLYLKAQELGIEIIGFAWAEGAVAKEYCTRFFPISTLEKEEILNVCIKERIDGILSIASDIAVPTVCYVADKMGLTANSIKSAEVSTNKFLMRQAFDKGGLNSPSYFKINNLKDLENHITELKFPLIVKPVDRSGSKGVNKVFDIHQLRIAISKALLESLCKEAIVEQFICGCEVSVETLSFNGEHHILAITDKVTSGNPHYVELEHHQPSLLPPKTIEIIKSETIKALKALDIKNGASHPEFLISDDGVFITEVGARMGGDFIGSDLVYLSTGYDFLKGVIDVALNQFQTPEKKWNKSSGVYFYSLETPKVGELILKDLHPDFKIRSEITSDTIASTTQSADRAGYFLYQSNTKLLI